MYYLAKLLQATALTIILIDFLRYFPNVMSRQVLGICIGLFAAGWLIERILQRR
jgi:hypothetical protein